MEHFCVWNFPRNFLSAARQQIKFSMESKWKSFCLIRRSESLHRLQSGRISESDLPPISYNFSLNIMTTRDFNDFSRMFSKLNMVEMRTSPWMDDESSKLFPAQQILQFLWWCLHRLDHRENRPTLGKTSIRYEKLFPIHPFVDERERQCERRKIINIQFFIAQSGADAFDV